MLLLGFYSAIPLLSVSYNSILNITRNSLIFAVTIEVCIVTYEYNLHSGRISGLVQDLFGKEECIESITNRISSTEDLESCYKELLLAIMNVIKLIVTVVNFSYRPSVLKYVMFTHRLLTASLTLQWFLCLRYVDRQISQAKRLIKSGLQQIACSDSSHCAGSLTDTPVVENKLKELEDAIEIYRKATDRRNHVNEYYRIYLLIYVCVSVSMVLLSVYTAWRIFRDSTDPLTAYYILILSFIELTCVTVTASICESADSEVRLNNSHIHINVSLRIHLN